MIEEIQVLNRVNQRLTLQNPINYTLKKIFEEKLDGNLKPILQSSTNMTSKSKQSKMQLFYNAKLRNINSTLIDIPIYESKSRSRMNNSVKIMRTEVSETEEIKQFRTIPQKNQSVNKRRRLKLRISVINQMMMYSEEQLQERCIDIFRKLAKPLANVPILDVRRLQSYLQHIFKNESIVTKTIKYLSIPSSMNYKNYCNLILGFNDWSKLGIQHDYLDILFFCFYIFQEDNSAFLDADSLFTLITSEQCFSDDANFIFKTLREKQQLNCRNNYKTFYTKLLKLPNLTYKKYKQESNSQNEQMRRSKLDVYQIKTKVMFSHVSELQTVEKENMIYELPNEKEDEILVTFETFRNIYSHSHPCFFGWLLKCLADIDIHFIGQKFNL